MIEPRVSNGRRSMAPQQVRFSSVLPRLQLFEYEDQRWLPHGLRDAITDYLRWLGNLSNAPYRHFASALATALRETGSTRLIDLCAGGSGPIVQLLPLLQAAGVEAKVTLTDLYPNIETMKIVSQESQGRISYLATPTDATNVPAHLEGFRVICNAFHHFPPEQARRILASACCNGVGIAVFEGLERTLSSILTCASTLALLPMVAPFIRPLSLRKLLWTYLIPVASSIAAWDGVVSSFRCYTPAELLQMGREVEPGYRWEAARCPVPFSPVGSTYLIGVPG